VIGGRRVCSESGVHLCSRWNTTHQRIEGKHDNESKVRENKMYLFLLFRHWWRGVRG
jgi:hypothetical protein